MMGEMEDDFGDLYADVELQVSDTINAVSGFNQLYLENDSKNEIDGVDDHVASELMSKKVNSISQESTLCSKDEGKLIENVTETPNSEAHVEEELIVDSGSDSEDDLHIVLNEDDCCMHPVPRNAITSNRRLTEGSDDEDDDLVIVTDANRPSNDRNLMDQLQSSCDGLEQTALCSGAEKGNGMKGSHPSQYSQYKYIRPINSKGSRSGAAVPLSSPLSGKCDWDVNGSNRQMVSSMPHTASSSSTIIPFVAQRGYDFSLPRYRTILGVNIDTFERKPWIHPGADITDFFNFGLDEESWKEYCNHLEQFRQHHQHTNMLAKNPESLRLNQASGLEFEHETVAPEAVTGESGQIGDATKVSLSLKNADRGGKWLEVPKGRAIQVEGGIGERQPSMDVRRPRNRDSDVVIQISVHDSSRDSSGSSEQEGHEDNSVLEISKSRDFGTDDNSDMHDSDGVHKDTQSIKPVDEYSNRFSRSHVKDYGARRLTRCSQPTATSNALTLDPDGQVNEHICDEARHHRQKAKEKIFKDEKMLMQVEQTKEAIVNVIPSKAGPRMLEAESNSETYFDSRSKAPNDEMDFGLDRALKPSERPSSNSAPESWESMACDSDNSKDSGSNDSDMEFGECKFDSKNQSPNHVKQNHCSRMQLRSVAELKDHRDDDEDALMSDRKDWYGGDHSKVNHDTHKRWRRNNGVYDGEEMSYYRGTEVSTGCRSDRPVDRKARNGCTENFHGIPRYIKDDKDRFPTRHWHENDYFLDEGITAEYRRREDYLHERGHTKDRINSFSYKKSRSLSGHSSLYTEEARNPWQRRKRDDKSRFRKRTPDDEYELEHRCIEDLEEKYGRHVPYNDREPFKEKYDRHIPYIGREIERSGRRNRYCRSPYPDLDTSWSSAAYDDEFWRHPDHRCIAVDTCREVEIVKERRWQDITSPRNDTSDIRRFDERHFDHWRPIKHRDSGWLDPIFENDYHAEDRTIYPDADIYKKGRRFGQRPEAFHWVESKLCSRHQDQDEMYSDEEPSSFKRNKKHERIHVEREPTHHGFVINEQIGSKIIREEIRISEISNHNNSGINIICRVKHEQAALRSRDSALGGWEGKSGRCSKAEDVRCNGGHSHMDQMVDNEQTVFRHSDEAHTRVGSHSSRSKIEVRQCKLKPTNDEKWLDKYPITQYHEASDLEEGQLPEEPEKKEIAAIEEKHVSGSTTGIGDMKGGRVKVEDSGNEEKGVGGYDNRRILETMVKMEKRRERFKEPIPLKEPGKNPKPEPAPTVETADIKQQRPLRKRRWAGIGS
ncbi:FIP1[V]-like protein isoform X2 [Telopea speciosissima]|uniref:FIP1[V]-like protein isoform X2 n=1 Tax=Telopea speciosissima TaxID=54955 RepID=UPI001CC49718|nr:FIP1[V]-like protein isoform X2 [Telopea speciosissima]